VRNVVAAQGDVDFHARRHVVADDFDHIALRLEARRRPVGDLDLDELADLGAAVAPGGHQHFLLDLRVVRGYVTDAAFFEVAADHALVGTGDDFDEHAFAAATAVDTGDAGQAAVAVEHQAHLRRAEEQVVAAVVGNQEAEAVAVAGDAAADQVELVYRGIGAAPGIDKLAIALHGAQAAAQGFDLVFLVQTELFASARGQQVRHGRRGAAGSVRGWE
jgi:hypothetical protein